MVFQVEGVDPVFVGNHLDIISLLFEFFGQKIDSDVARSRVFAGLYNMERNVFGHFPRSRDKFWVIERDRLEIRRLRQGEQVRYRFSIGREGQKARSQRIESEFCPVFLNPHHDGAHVLPDILDVRADNGKALVG